MNILSQHIEILLLEHDCVVVPRIGGFISNKESAKYEVQEKLFLPPYRSVAFNNKLTVNDGLLVQSYMQAYDAAYPEALRQLEKDVDSLILQLDTTGEYAVGSVGILTKDIDGRITLQTTESGILSPAYYGLYSFNCLTVSELQKERETESALSQTSILPIQTESDLLNNIGHEKKEEENTIDNKDSDIERENTRFIIFKRKAIDISIAAVVAGILFSILSFATMNINDNDDEVCVASTFPVNTTVKKEQSTAPKVEATVEQTETQEPVVETPEIKSQNTETYTIVMASYVTESNANIYINQLIKDGFTDAHFVAGKVNRIHYGSYTTQEEAIDSLRQLRSKNSKFAQAWTLKLKN